MLQLFLRLGTWQLSDLFFNTLGGFIGGFIYWSVYRIKHIVNYSYAADVISIECYGSCYHTE